MFRKWAALCPYTGWKHAQELFCEMIEEYLASGKYGHILKDSKGVAAGFVDGELTVLFTA